jgi:hypothetical protein
VFDVATPNAPKPKGVVDNLEGNVVGVHPAGSETWIELETRRAIPASQAFGMNAGAAPALSAPATTPAASPAPAQPTVKPEAPVAWRASNVVKVTPETVEINAGTAEGVAVGDRLTIFRMRAASDEQPDYVSRERVAVVTVTAVREHSSLAEVPRGARVTVSDAVERAKPDESDSLAFPERLDHLLDLQATLRPLANVGTPAGGGIMFEGAATYLGRGYFAGARLQPLAVGGTKEGAVVSTSLMAEGGFDARPFALGLGLGVSAVSGNLDSLLGYSATFDPTTGLPQDSSTKSAFTLGQIVRLGARDGLNFQLVNVLLFHKKPTGESGFIYGATTGKLSIPLMQSTDLYAEGGGGVMGYAYGALGVHTWLVGRGDAGSLALSVAAGGAGMWGRHSVTVTPVDGGGSYSSYESVSITGPMASLGFQYRMGL